MTLPSHVLVMTRRPVEMQVTGSLPTARRDDGPDVSESDPR